MSVDIDSVRGGPIGIPLMISLAFIYMVTTSVTTSSMGILINPIRTELGWTAGQVSGLASAFFLGAAFASFGVGSMLDRLGGRKTMTGGVVVAGISLLLASQSSNSLLLYVLFVSAGAGCAGSMTVPCAYVASRHIHLGLGLVLGVILCVAAIGSATVPIFVERLISQFGWRAALASCALCIALLAPIILTVIPRRDARASSSSQLPDATARETTPIAKLALVLLMQILFVESMMGIYVHFVPIFISNGFTEGESLYLYSLSNIVSFVGFLGIGFLSNRYGIFPVLLSAIIFNSLSIMALILSMNVTSRSCTFVILFIVGWGLSAGSSSQLAPAIVGRLAPVSIAGRCYGISGLVDGIAASIGPVGAGLLADLPGGYDNVVAFSALSSFLAIVPVVLLRRSIRDTPPEIDPS